MANSSLHPPEGTLKYVLCLTVWPQRISRIATTIAEDPVIKNKISVHSSMSNLLNLYLNPTLNPVAIRCCRQLYQMAKTKPDDRILRVGLLGGNANTVADEDPQRARLDSFWDAVYSTWTCCFEGCDRIVEDGHLSARARNITTWRAM